MPVILSDDELRETGLTERQIRIELACRLFDTQHMALWPAAKLAGMSRGEFERELLARKIPAYRYTREAFDQDLRTLSNSEA